MAFGMRRNPQVPSESSVGALWLFFFLWIFTLVLRETRSQPRLRLATPRFAPLSAADGERFASDLGSAYADLLRTGSKQ